MKYGKVFLIMSNLFILSIIRYFFMIGGMYLLIRSILLISCDQLPGIILSMCIVLLVSIIFADQDRRRH